MDSSGIFKMGVFRRKCSLLWLTFSKGEVSSGTCEKTGSTTMYGQEVKVSVSNSVPRRDD